jgi:hypothetical protein
LVTLASGKEPVSARALRSNRRSRSRFVAACTPTAAGQISATTESRAGRASADRLPWCYPPFTAPSTEA